LAPWWRTVDSLAIPKTGQTLDAVLELALGGRLDDEA
jgi:hypothetical protein